MSSIILNQRIDQEKGHWGMNKNVEIKKDKSKLYLVEENQQIAIIGNLMQPSGSNECLATGFRFSVTHDDPPFGQSEPLDGCGKSPGDETLLLQLQQQPDGSCSEKPITCDYLSPYAFTARNSLGSTSG
ncbi:PREDICTED: uncharacterized protein LOC107171331 [Diuraphis noxia]|uniref:uncharacterized protein LOC107171331 n=1 Tax=Diuraphis noxia TaxID=143948 RepID=UPI0007636BA2|nr:PREDICTED: uncharacterized protein LOC107171331 [Diuraphis noxia]